MIYKLKSFKKGLALVEILKDDTIIEQDDKFIYLTQEEFNKLDKQVITDGRRLLKWTEEL